ncbi:pimeloyl-ACP methyl ester carboxylesterase [Crossiella equi]|uniref:Pimeloyl-ACP methyl ester carboxylesterase n=1 Tax=Crossiella equi TaxID=130796 RepID=A0ABS5AR09_9PSEU|nr:alpha/beta hydrolase [Crossiella equi]MBP2478881.1 pimeloyl-ACP methyl ester carboxylesterase [Crossiella equi]
MTTDADRAASLGFESRFADVNGTRLHHVIGGTGSPLVLLGGWPQTWWQFRKIMPALAERHRVVVAEIRGQGASAKPESGYDKKTMARDVHELLRHLDIGRADVAGHDIGAMVAHSLAANHPESVRRLVLLDVPHPDESMYQFPLVPRPGAPIHKWWFAFNQIRGLPERLLAGRSRHLIDHLCELMLVDQDAIPAEDREIYAAVYDQPESIRAANGWYQTWGQDIEDVKTYPKLTLPVLALVCKANFDYVRSVVDRQVVGADVRLLADTGHYLAEEQPEEVIRHLQGFLAA